MHWKPIVADGKSYDLSHLHPFVLRVTLDAVDIRLVVSFGHHVFSDEKGRGLMISVGGEERSFSPVRYEASFQAASYARERMLESHARPYFNRKRQQQYFVLEDQAYAIFMTIQKSEDPRDTLKCRICFRL
jgi:hypothetical protein